MNYEYLKVTMEAGTGWLEYNRPPINTFNMDMLGEVRAALDALIADEACRVIVFASAVKGQFSAGADIEVLDGIGAEGMREIAGFTHDIVRAMRASPKPLLAAIEGAAVGGGFELTLHCDLRFAASDIRVGSPEVNLNFVPPIAGTQGLARLMGRSRALDYLYRGEMLTAEAAARAGLVDFVHPPGSVRPAVSAYAEDLAEKPPEALAAIRACVVGGGALDFEAGMEVELGQVAALAGTKNFEEGVRAFLERRRPKWA